MTDRCPLNCVLRVASCEVECHRLPSDLLVFPPPMHDKTTVNVNIKGFLPGAGTCGTIIVRPSSSFASLDSLRTVLASIGGMRRYAIMPLLVWIFTPFQFPSKFVLVGRSTFWSSRGQMFVVLRLVGPMSSKTEEQTFSIECSVGREIF
jgi:hypothetical protein